MAHVRETLAGRYDVLGILGRGGMGVVYRATDRVLDRPVAIKVLPVDRAADPTFVARFEREALAAAALNHPNIVAIYDSGRDEDTRFIAMEFVPGRSLAETLADEGALASEDAAPIASQIAAALGAAHKAGVIHRDIKPANVMVGDDGRVKVLDFGIARAAADATLTQSDVILGSAPYLAPEVTTGLPADARSDIYALGCVTYAMLTGAPPFTGDLPAAVMHQHVAATPRPPRELVPAIPAGIEALVLQMLAKDPDDRPQSAAQLARALGGVVLDRAATTIPLPRLREAPTAPLRVPRRATPPPHRRTGRVNVPLLAALAVPLIVLAALVLASGSGSHKAAAKRPVAHRVRHQAATRLVTASLTTRTQSPSATAQSSSSSTPAPGPPTVAGAVTSLTALLTNDAQSGTLDAHAVHELLGPLQGAFEAYQNGDPAGALGPVGDLSGKIAKLQGKGDIQSSAAGPLSAGINLLQLALQRSVPQTPASPGDHHGHGGGDGGGGNGNGSGGGD
jgi:serine/threonine-protein kinase